MYYSKIQGVVSIRVAFAFINQARYGVPANLDLTTPTTTTPSNPSINFPLMEQQRAINALEPFLALSKSANSPRAAADLVAKATSAPNTYVFAELLHTPNISALRDSAEFSSYYKLLEIFAWGTWADYQCTLCDFLIPIVTLTTFSNPRSSKTLSSTTSETSTSLITAARKAAVKSLLQDFTAGTVNT